MNSIQQARAGLADILREIDGLQVYDRLGETVDPPAVMISLPRVEFNGPPGEPTDATFTIPIFAAVEGRDTSDELARWLPIVAKALEDNNIPVRPAEPGTWPAGGTDLPAYLIQVEVALPWR